MSIGRVQSIETLEQRYPLRFHQYSLREGSAGHGRFRGGFGVHFEFEFTGGEGQASLLGDQAKTAPVGRAGGEPGHTSAPWFRLGGRTITLPMISKGENVRLRAGDLVCLRTPGGGGYGPAAERDPDAVAADIAWGYLDERTAREKYA
jgi:N-methylhydantoinase B